MPLEKSRGAVAQRLRMVGVAALLAIVGVWLTPSSAADTFGSLLIESDPVGATVYVDGRFAGQTPLKLTSTPSGVHRVRLELIGYLENSQLVTVNDGKETRLRTKLTVAPQQLKIVVLEGEGGVNIIQQKTAIAPVVEVRDRNDVPVSGAVVRFVIQKGRASFHGAPSVTTTTDALGRATPGGFTPSAAGALQIGAFATFQGQTAAVAIAQMNVMTAAEAATRQINARTTGGASAGGAGCRPSPLPPSSVAQESALAPEWWHRVLHKRRRRLSLLLRLPLFDRLPPAALPRALPGSSR